MTNPSPLALSPNASVEVMRIGQEDLPLMRIGNALEQIDLVRKIAAQHSYRPIGPFYPGVRAVVSERIAMPLVEPLLPAMQQIFELERVPKFFECYLSVVTRHSSELDPIQRLPHFDGLERERLAALLYLDSAEHGGTSFYRQRETGFESIDRDRYDTYRSTLESEIEKFGVPDPAYIGDDTAMFERIAEVEPDLGSMVIYHGNALHCASLGKDFVPQADPLQGRLTLNLFLH